MTALIADATDLFGITYLEAIWRMSKAGGDAITIAPGGFTGRQIMLDAGRVYWLANSRNSVTTIAKTGGTTKQIEISPSFTWLEWSAGLIEGDNLYLKSSGMIGRVPTSGGNLVPLVCPAAHFTVYRIAADATRLFFVATRDDVVGSSVQAVDRQ